MSINVVDESECIEQDVLLALAELLVFSMAKPGFIGDEPDLAQVYLFFE